MDLMIIMGDNMLVKGGSASVIGGYRERVLADCYIG
jgi:hypothetical protein